MIATEETGIVAVRPGDHAHAPVNVRAHVVQAVSQAVLQSGGGRRSHVVQVNCGVRPEATCDARRQCRSPADRAPGSVGRVRRPPRAARRALPALARARGDWRRIPRESLRIEASSPGSLQSSARGRPRFLPSSSSSPSQCRTLLTDGTDRSMGVQEGRERACTPERVPRDGSGSGRARGLCKKRGARAGGTLRARSAPNISSVPAGSARAPPARPRGAGAF